MRHIRSFGILDGNGELKGDCAKKFGEEKGEEKEEKLPCGN